MFRGIWATLLLSAAIVAPAQAEPQPGLHNVGGDVDAHGCLIAAGYTWSTLRQGCIQMWTAGIRLDPIKPQGLATFSAFIVFASWYDHHRVELFLRDVKGSLILEKTHGAWRNDSYVLTRRNGVYALADGQGAPIYVEASTASK